MGAEQNATSLTPPVCPCATLPWTLLLSHKITHILPLYLLQKPLLFLCGSIAAPRARQGDRAEFGSIPSQRDQTTAKAPANHPFCHICNVC